MAEMLTNRQFELADAIEIVMEGNLLSHGWTPSELGRKVKAPAHEIGPVLDWMVCHAFLACDNRGAWTHYFRRH